MTVLAQSNLTGSGGAAATAGNTGFDAVTSNAALTVDTVGGKNALSIGAAVATALYGTWNSTTLTTAQTDVYIAVDLYYPATSISGAKTIVRGYDSSAAQSWAVALSSQAASTSPARVVIRNAANTATYTSPTGIVVPLGQWCRVEVHAVMAGAAGTVQVRVFNTDSDATILYDTGVQTISNGSNNQQFRFGQIDQPTIAAGMKAMRIGDSAGWLGPYGTGATGTATITVTGVATAAAAAAGTGAITVTGAATGLPPGTTGTAGITVTATATARAAATGTAALTVTATAAVSTAITQWLALPTAQRNIAHRGGGVDFPEMTMQAYAQCAAISSKIAFNVDGWLSSDGVLVASHDKSTLRVTGTDLDITANTWATLSALRTTVGNQPLCRVKDVLDAYAATRVIFIENKQGSTAQSAFNTLLSSYPTATTNFVWKTYYQGTSGFTSAKTAGACGAGWGYWFAADSAAITTGNIAPWDILGEDYTASSGDWSTMLGLAGGKVVIGHVIASQANATTAYGLGAQGLMTSKILTVVPNDQAAGTAAITVAGVATGTAQASGAASVTVTAAGTAAAQATGTASLIYTAAAAGSAAASGTGAVAMVGVAYPGVVTFATGAATLTFVGVAVASGPVIVVPTPPERTLTVAAEPRTVAVTGESRTVVVAADTRTQEAT